ncbi:MAG: hypothetical protein DDT27_01444 [Dehalococcoidia bacterium]|nr:hypothetical protein [Chloroflexota bacterium]
MHYHPFSDKSVSNWLINVIDFINAIRLDREDRYCHFSTVQTRVSSQSLFSFCLLR